MYSQNAALNIALFSITLIFNTLLQSFNIRPHISTPNPFSTFSISNYVDANASSFYFQTSFLFSKTLPFYKQQRNNKRRNILLLQNKIFKIIHIDHYTLVLRQRCSSYWSSIFCITSRCIITLVSIKRSRCKIHNRHR